MRFLSMAALAVMGAVMTGCSSDDNFIDEPQQPENKSNVVTLTTTVSLDGGAATTRALTAAGVKTFAAGETMALVYKNTSSETVKAVSVALTDGDITNEGKSATFTFELTDPDRTKDVTYIYPAAMATDAGEVNYAALATQDGTLATLSSTLDLATKTAAWNDGSLPAATLANQLAILAITLKDNATPTANDITSTITGVTLSDGTNSYAVTRTAAAGPIYVAIQPTTSANITVTATDGTTNYSKSLTGKTYAASNGYSLSWRMAVVVPSFTIDGSGTKVLFAPGNLQATWNGTSWTWGFAAHQYDYIGNAAGNTSINGNGTVSASNVTVDLFGWVGASNTAWSGDLGTTGNAAMYGISNSSTTNSTNTYGNVASEALKSDWGNTISDGYTWRTLSGGSGGEWEWILGPSSNPTPGTNCRTSSTVNGTANARFAKATVVGKSGIIIFPDTYTHPDGVTAPSSINTANAAFTVNSYDATEWGKMETAGCVFLPAAGYRNQAEVYNVGHGYYCSSSPYTSGVSYAYRVYFYYGGLNPAGNGMRYYGFSVRLVRQVE